jgi:predicted Rossmann fold nucleotide-binding protein DprA/Smf involved in DNA uptake
MAYHEQVKAFYARNRLIAEDADILLAMAAPDRKGGTENALKHAIELNKIIILI